MRGVASFVGSTSPRFVDLPDPREPNAGQVLCRTLELGICGTDRDILASGQPWTAPASQYLVLGHECLARVELVGPGVDSLRTGDLVVPLVRRALPLPLKDDDGKGTWFGPSASPSRPSFRGSASQRAASEALPRAAETEAETAILADPARQSLASSPCPGRAWAREGREGMRRVDLLPFGHYVERGILSEHGFSLPFWLDEPQYLLPIEPGFRPLAVFTEPQAVAEKAANEALRLQQARLGYDAWAAEPPRVLVTGLGPIAFAAAIASVSRGWPTTVCGRDAPDTARARLASELGAGYRSMSDIDFDSLDVERDGFDLVLECTGSEEVILKTARVMASCAVMVWLGSSRIQQAAELNVARLIRDGLVRNQIFLGSVNAAVRDFYDAMSHLRQMHAAKPQALAAVITARIAPDDALWHFEHRQPQGIKTVVAYE
jgi:threonine dehydrogenase-like Zn-dependent dehydrogenase